jgi:hypothetical protein
VSAISKPEVAHSFFLAPAVAHFGPRRDEAMIFKNWRGVGCGYFSGNENAASACSRQPYSRGVDNGYFHAKG